jgi:hypothetical protein
VVLVVAAVMVVTFVLCCLAVSQVAPLFFLDVPGFL